MSSHAISSRKILTVSVIVLALLALTLFFISLGRSKQAPISVSGPLDLQVQIVPPEPALGQSFQVLVHLVPVSPTSRIQISVNAEGAVELSGQYPTGWNDPSINVPLSASFPFRAARLGRGEILIHFSPINDSGYSTPGNAINVFFYVGEDRTFVGSHGTLELEKKYLSHLFWKGKISLSEYQRRLEALQGGGATVTSPSS